MKKIILLIVLIPFFIFSQIEDFNCGFIPDVGMYDTSKYSATVSSNFLEDEPIVFNVYYHIINPSDGINPWGVTEEHILASIAQLNINFNQYNIFYKYTGFRTINDDAIFNANEFDFSNLLNLNNDYPDSINVMITPPLASAATAYRPEQYVKYAAQFFTNTSLDNTIITHEFGHLAGLFHVFAGTASESSCSVEPDSGYCIENDICIPIIGITESPELLNTPHFATPVDLWSEHVTRDVSSPHFNADVKGDMVVDTPASFYGAYNNFCKDLTTNTVSYISHPNVFDNSDTNQVYIDEDLTNFMNYNTLLKTHFTDGQSVRMREEILSPSNTQYTPRMTEVTSLYEPYAGEYFLVGPNLPEHRPLFQPGFDYIFVSCSGDYNVPSDYDDVSFSHTNTSLNKLDKYSLDLYNINHPNHSAIVVEQLENQPRKCYNNYNRSASNGTVIKYVDGVPNNNVIIDTKNQTQINNPNLISDLENGLYIIQKSYDDGTQEQNTILKNDD